MRVRELLVHFGINVDDKPVAKLHGTLSTLAKGFAVVGAAGAAAAGALFGMAASVAKAGDEWREMAIRAGVGVEELQKLAFAAKLGGADATTLELAFKRLNLSMFEAGQGGKEATDSFNAVGISVKDIKGKTAGQVLLMLADRLKAIEDPALRSAAAQRLLGRSGTMLLPTLLAGSKAITDAGERAQRYGAILSGEATEAGDKFSDSLVELDAMLLGIRNAIGIKLMPVIGDLIMKAGDWLQANRELISQHLDRAVDATTTAIGKLWGVLLTAGDAVKDITDAFGGWRGTLEAIGLAIGVLIVTKLPGLVLAAGQAVTALSALMLANPITALMLLIGTLAVLIKNNWSELQEFFGEVFAEWENMAGKFRLNVLDPIANMINEFLDLPGVKQLRWLLGGGDGPVFAGARARLTGSGLTEQRAKEDHVVAELKRLARNEAATERLDALDRGVASSPPVIQRLEGRAAKAAIDAVVNNNITIAGAATPETARQVADAAERGTRRGLTANDVRAALANGS